jgi:TRAP-type C4-dicarboxylate transport system substrate-binding protein
MCESKLLASGAPAFLGLALMAGPAAAETVELTVVAAAPPTVSNVKSMKEVFIPEVDKRLAASGKDYKIEWKEAYGSTLSTFTEVLETVEEGIGHVAVILKTFEESKLPLEQIAYMVPFGDQTPAQMVAIDTEMRKKLPILNQQYLKYKQVFLQSAASPGMDLFTTFKVTSVDDLKGHKIGASGAMGNYLRDTGAVVVTSSMLDSYTSIRNGVYEGYPISVGLAFPYRTYQAAKYRLKVNFGTTATSAISVNEGAWKKLPDFAQAIFREAAFEWSKGIARIDAERDAMYLKKMEKDKVVVTQISPQERRKWAMTMPNIAQEWAEAQEKKGLPGKLVLKTFMDELRSKNIMIARAWDKE